MDFYEAFSYMFFGNIDSLTEKKNIEAFNVTTIDGRCYEGIADEISALRKARIIQLNSGKGWTRLAEVVYHLNSNEIVTYILDTDGNRRYMVKQLYYLCEVGKKACNYLDNEEVRKLIDIINNYEDRTTFKKTKYSNHIIRKPFDINGNEIDFSPLILAIINQYMRGSALTKDSWGREFQTRVDAHEGKIKFYCWAEKYAYHLHYHSMTYEGMIDTSKSEIFFYYVNFGFGNDK